MKKILFFFLLSTTLYAQNGAFLNPIIPGAHPDPSICRVGDTFYLVNSSFEYFPGLPIHKSTDLVNWELVGYGLHREEQCNDEVNLVDVQSDGGIHAPTIRYHQGLFYIISTNVYYNADSKKTDFVNFIITAENIAGPWSEPHVLEGAPGIDPDIFFDDNGKVWYVGTHSPEDPSFPGEGEIWLQEIDLENWQLKGERHFLWRGACGGVWAEGPHMYKRDGRYYLMIAEGGTSFNHAVMIAVSDKITGPYIPNERNPILTTRHLSYDNWVVSTGHADLIELADGRWYMVALGVRGDEDRSSNMGRETFLLPVKWEREPFEWKEVRYEWPVCAPISGKIERVTPLPFPNKAQYRNDAFGDNFDSPSLDLEWNFRRVPQSHTYDLSKREGFLRLFATPAFIKERERCSLIGFRQKESDFEYVASMEFNPSGEGMEAGVSIVQKDNNYFTFTIIQNRGRNILQLSLALPGESTQIIKQRILDNYRGEICFRLLSKDHQYLFEYSLDGGASYHFFEATKANHLLSKGYTGAYLGMYCTSNGQEVQGFADFDWVQYTGFPKMKKP